MFVSNPPPGPQIKVPEININFVGKNSFKNTTLSLLGAVIVTTTYGSTTENTKMNEFGRALVAAKAGRTAQPEQEQSKHPQWS